MFYVYVEKAEGLRQNMLLIDTLTRLYVGKIEELNATFIMFQTRLSKVGILPSICFFINCNNLQNAPRTTTTVVMVAV